MSASYLPTLTRTLDWVRFLIGDTDISAARLQDEEILAVIGEVTQGNKYLAAARCGELLIVSLGGVTSKQVGDLKLTFRDGEEEEPYRKYLCGLQARGALQVGPTRNRFFEAL